MFSQHVQNVLGSEDKQNAVKNLMFDLASGEDIFDKNGNKVTKKEANDKLRKFIRNDIFELDEHSSKKERKRAYEKHGREFFDIIEEVIELKLDSGWKQSEFFNTFVDYRNKKVDDRLDFVTEDKSLVNIARVSGEHHDFWYVIKRVRIVKTV